MRDTEPAGQYQPAWQMLSGCASPAPRQAYPGVHAKQPATLTTPWLPLNVPAGHGVGVPEPSGQYVPTGHSAPSGAPVGFGTWEPFAQYHPAAQGPLGAVRPVALQNAPAGHGRQLATDAPPGLGLYVPTGHGACVA